jgi:UDP-glucuronate 4-epimerase
MKAIVTGVAGFIGSHLAERLVSEGWDVIGVDCLTPYYEREQKASNLAAVQESTGGIDLRTVDLRADDLDDLVHGADAIFHQAGQPGVRASWDDFDDYVSHNVIATKRLLEAARNGSVGRFVYASSSSVYGDAESYPTYESTLPAPKSPYGVTKLAAEHLVGLYARNWGLPTVSLRYFTVFGPRQRPDMAMHRLIRAALEGSAFPLYGTGTQIRDFTYVGDVVAANLLAAVGPVEPGSVFNIAGGGSISLAEVIDIVERLTGRSIALDRLPPAAGDVERTGGSTEKAARVLSWMPEVSVEAGLARQVEWHQR